MSNFFIVITVGIAVSYGWGMRGSLMGGERGAALPGALLGMFLAVLSGNAVIRENFYIFATAGASAMAFGGTEPYGETLGFVLHRGREDYNPKKGFAGVFLKGALWQGITGAVMGMTFSAAGGYYTGPDLIVVIAVIPLIQALGVRIFNKPYDKEKGIFPRIYFSEDSREEWGGNLLTLIMLLIFTLAHKDFYSFFFSAVGIVGGGIGFSAGIAIYDFLNHPMKNGRMPGGRFSGYLDGWKIMEFIFGLISGLSFAAYFVLTESTMLAERTAGLTEGQPLITGLLTPYADAVAFVSLALIFIVKIFYIFEKKLGDHGLDLIERPVLFVLPMLAALSGCELSARFTSFVFIVFYAAEKVVMSRSEKCSIPFRVMLGIVFGLLIISSAVMCVFAEMSPIVYILMYTVFYIIADNIPLRKINKNRKAVLTCFAVQSIFLIAVTAII